MSTPDPVPAASQAAVPWYQSAVQKAQIAAALSAVVALSPKAGQVLGITNASQASAYVETFFGLAAVFAPLIGSVLRARSKIQPLTLTKAAAEVHPATLAAKAAQQPPSATP